MKKNKARLKVNGREVVMEQLTPKQWRVSASLNGEVLFDHRMSKRKADEAWKVWTDSALSGALKISVTH
jgi:hypothetical protein